jgi:hypothetical protein
MTLRTSFKCSAVVVPLLMITHVVAFYLLVRPLPEAAPALGR